MAVNRSERDGQPSLVAMGVGGLVALVVVIWVVLRLVRALFFIVKIGVIVAAVVLAAIAVSKTLGKRER